MNIHLLQDLVNLKNKEQDGMDLVKYFAYYVIIKQTLIEINKDEYDNLFEMAIKNISSLENNIIDSYYSISKGSIVDVVIMQ